MAYIVRADIEDRWGTAFVTKYGDIDGTGVAGDITARVAEAITAAESKMNARLRGGRYAVPLTGYSDSEGLIKDIACTYAAEWLYSYRGITDRTTTSKLEAHLERVNDMLDMILSQQVSLDADAPEVSEDSPTGAVVID